jgi:CubicO group peptidase (beta-lactamase class C family)
MKNLALLISLYFVTTSLVAQNASIRSLHNRLDGLYKTFFSEDGVGCATLISKKGKIIYQKGFGKADVELNVAASPASIFRIGSITKQFTAIAILQLYEQGLLDLNDEIQKHIPGFPLAIKRITIENLLTHTSGIQNITEIKDLEIKQRPYTVEELIDLFKDKPLDFQAGDKYRYSNSGYILLGSIIEKLSGKKYADYIKSNLFEKIGMKNSYYDNASQIIKNRAHGYDLDTTYNLTNASYLNTTFPYSAGGLLMSVEDYFKWHQALWSYKLIKKETLQKALTPYKLHDGSFTNYGYGWAFEKLLGSETIEHGGFINGFSCKSLYLPKEDILVVIFSNNTFLNIKGMADQAAAIAADKKQFKEIAVSSRTKKKYSGTYKFSQDDPATIKIYEDKGQLFLKDSNSPTAWQMHFTAENEFICYEVYPNTQIFSKSESGEIEFLIIKNFDYQTKVKKVK